MGPAIDMNPRLLRRPLLACVLFMAAAIAADTNKTIESAIKADRAGKHEKALKLFKKAAEGGDHKAMTMVGLKYYAGEGTGQDYCEAYDWFNKARVHDADALNNIGVMFRDGQCVKQNRKIAYLSFLIIHMEGMGTEQTQLRANRNLRRERAEIPLGEVQEALCYTLSYYRRVIDTRGENMNATAEHMPAQNNPRFKETAWWLPHERESLNFACPKPWHESAADEKPQVGQDGSLTTAN